MTNNQTLLSLYKNPLAAGSVPTDLPIETAHHDRLFGYLRRTGLNDESAIELAEVESMPHIPPRACVEFSPVVSMPHIPPRACVEFSPVVSMPHIPPRA
jgi:hypothetical protein